jgi:glycosyltransferase involved in cell wall biosynthesis
VLFMRDLKISVALATFNGTRYLLEQLQSLALQEFLPHELVAVDDGSSDNTVGLLQQFAQVTPFPVRIHQNASRLGYGMNFLKAAKLCCGDAIAFCDQDDVWAPAKLRRVYEAMAAGQADFVAHTADVTDAGLTLTGQRYPDIDMDACWESQVFRQMFYPGFAIAVTGRFFEQVKSLMAQPGFAIEAHDELLCELAEAGWRRCELSESLVQYRQHGENLIGYHWAMQKKRIA